MALPRPSNHPATKPFMWTANMQRRDEQLTIKQKYGPLIKEMLVEGKTYYDISVELGIPVSSVIANAPPMSIIRELRRQKAIRDAFADKSPIVAAGAKPVRPAVETKWMPPRDERLDNAMGKCPKCGHYRVLPCSQCFND